MTDEVQGEPPSSDSHGAGGAHVCGDDLAKAAGPEAPRKLPHRYAQRLIDESTKLYEARMAVMLDEIVEELSR